MTKGVRFVVDRETLNLMYQTQTMNQIAKHFNVGETVVWTRIKQFGIKLEGFENPRCRPKPFTPEHLQAIKDAGGKRRGKWAGEKNPNWRGGLTDKNLAARRTGAYKQWKLRSLELAEYKCQVCGAVKGSVCSHCGQKVALHVHHSKSFAKHEELRFDPTNSEVLCSTCHNSRHFGKTR